MNGRSSRALQLAGLLLLGILAFAFGRSVAASSGAGASRLGGSLPALREVLHSNDPLAQVATVTPVLLAMRRQDVEAVAGVFEASFIAGADGGLALDLLVERLTVMDPVSAHDRVLTWPLQSRSRALPILLQQWARSDPHAALETLNQIRDPQGKEAAFPALIQGWAESGQPGYWRYLAELPSSMELDRERAIMMLVQQLIARESADAAIRVVEQLPSEPEMRPFKEAALRTTVGILARSDPGRAAALAAAHQDDPHGGLLMRRVAVNWVTQDGPAAMTWLLEQPANQRRERVMREAYRRWVARDRTAAVAWVVDRPDYAGLEAIFDMQATALARIDVQAAVAWVDGIEDSELREAAKLDLAMVWHHQDPEGARSWLEAAGLLEEVQERAENRARAQRSRKNAERQDGSPNPPRGERGGDA